MGQLALAGYVEDLVKVRRTKEIREVDMIDILTEYVGDESLINEQLVEEWSNVLRNTARIRIISPQEENLDARLGDSVSMMIRQAAAYPLLDLPTERELGHRIRAGDNDARDEFVRCNMRLVISIAKKHNGQGLPMEDLIQEGYTGLLTAVKKYDPTRTTKFSTMATWWIRQSIKRAISSSSRVIAVPDYMHYTLNRVHHGEINFMKTHGYTPSDEELAEFIKEDLEKVQVAKRTLAQNPSSLDTPIGEDGDTFLSDYVPDTSIDSDTHETAARTILAEMLNGTLECLSDREREVISLRLGLVDNKTRTLEQVGDHFGITRERARQIESRAFTKLRSPNITEKFSGFL
ncbi:RNA polymerase sigma factor SigA [compost metagenome]